MSNFPKAKLDSPTRSLTLLYAAALFAVALLLLVGYFVVYAALDRQSSDSRVINIAGRQRMLSQKLSKDALLVYSDADASTRDARAAPLRETLDLWKSSQEGLQNGDVEAKLPGVNSVEIAETFAAIEPQYRTMLEAGNQLLATAAASNPNALNRSDYSPPVEKILAGEDRYLQGMNRIVFQYDREAAARVERLKRIQMWILFAALAALLLEALLIFRPAVKKVQQKIAEIERVKTLIQGEQTSVKLLQTTATAANEAASIEEAINICLAEICGFTGWSVGHAFLLADDGSELVSTDLWCVPDSGRLESFRRVTENTRFTAGVGLPGEVLATGKPAWIADLGAAGVNFPRARQAKQMDIRAAFAFPVVSERKVVGVLEFFHVETVAPDEKLLEIMALVGNQLGRVFEREHSKRELRESEERYRQIIDDANDIIYRADAGGRFTFVNPAAARLIKRPAEQLLGLSYTELVRPDYRRKAAEFYRRQSLERAAETYFEYPVITGDGSEIWFGQNVRLLVENERFAGFQAVARDITARKQAEDALEKERGFLSVLLENISDGIVACDENGVLTMFNRATREFHGLPEEPVAGDEWATRYDLFMPDGATPMEMEQVPLFRALRDGAVRDAEMVIAPKDLPMRRLVASGRAIFNPDGTKRGAVVGMHDITERAAAAEKFRVLFEYSSDAILLLGAGGIIDCNDAAVALLDGADKAHVLSLHPAEFSPERQPDGRLSKEKAVEMDRLAHENGFHRFDWTHRKTDGTEFPVEVTITPVTLDGKEVLLVVLHDLTERKLAEEQLKAKEIRLNEAQSIAHLGSWEFDIVENKVIWSDELYRVFGLEPQEYDGTFEGYLKFVHPDDLEVFTDTIERAMREKIYPSFDHRILRRDGETRFVHADGNVLVDADGAAIKMIGTLQDVTEQKQTEEALRESEKRLFQLLNAMPVGVFVLDALGKPYYANNAAQQILGAGILPDTSAAQLSEVYNAYLSGGEQLYPADRMPVVRALNGETVAVGDMEIHRSDSVIPLEVTAAPICDSAGNVVFAVAAFIDVTERKKIEAELRQAHGVALESARMKSEFLANMSHEIRTPMNGVIGMTGLLLDTRLDEEQRDYTETIQTSADALLRIIDDILDFSKIEAGQLQFETIDFDLSEAVEGAVELFAERARSKDIELASLVYSDVPAALRSDPGRLRQILTNLVGNALKFTERGEVTVSVHKQEETEARVLLRFEVRDTGIGISEEERKRLFQPFVQADGSTTRKYGGTGLGLAISKQMVELMGGEIGVRSAPGEGSTFWFTARFEKQAAGRATAVEPATDLRNLEAVRVLIVDDNRTNRRILLHQTASWGMAGSEAESGVEALGMLRAAAAAGTPFEIAILDLMMPKMDGFELARLIKADAAVAATLLVLLPSYGKRGDGGQARKSGIAAYIQKPVRQSQLHRCLMTVINEEPENKNGAAARLITRHTLRGAPVPTEQGLDTKTIVSKARVLVAEDNEINQKVALRQLKNLGYAADIVSNGREAVEAVEAQSYDLVLMDCQMPEMDGYEATGKIREREAAAKRTPIIAMTAHALEGEREKCLAAGMDDYISKPVKVEELAKLLEKWLFASSAPVEEIEPPPPSSEDVSPPVDMERLRLAMGDDPPEVREILAVYLKQMEDNLKKLSAAANAADAGEIDLIAHNCAGVSANCGMVSIVAPLRQLERLGRENRLTDAARLVGEIENEFTRLKVFLKNNLI